MSAETELSGGSMTTAEMRERFHQLQRKLVPLWETIGRSDPGGPLEEPNTIVVVPSLSADIDFPSPLQAAYEERFLFMLFLLRQPEIRMIYVTSLAIQPSVVDYYLGSLPGVVIGNARRRLFLVSPLDASRRPLTQKLLDRPRLLRHIRSLIPDPNRAHIVPFNTTDMERELAVRLDIPMYAADPDHVAFGTKSGCRRIFAEEDVLHPAGTEDLYSPGDVASALAQLHARRPAARSAVVKLNEGVSGMGNALVDLTELPPGDATLALLERLRTMRFELPEVTYDYYMERLVAGGAIVEERIEGDEIRSPSAQLRISPLGDVELLSTHDQLLGGPSGQSFLGARFPADPAYAWPIMRESEKVGRRLAREGVIGRFALDFVTVRGSDGAWVPYAIEINLRKGGTTAPFLTLQYLTDGQYDPQRGLFTTARGQEKYYVASDHAENHAYRVFTPDDLFDILTCYRLQFDQTTQTGVVLHMLSGVGGLGQLGLTAIADTPAAADALYHHFLAVLDKDAAAALSAD